MTGGARGSFWVTQAAAGVENGLRIRVSGSRGTLEWQQEHPQVLDFKPLDAPAQRLTPRGPGRACRWRCAAPAWPPDIPKVSRRRSPTFTRTRPRRSRRAAPARAPDPLALHFPNAHDGWMGMRFVDAVIRSAQAGGAWTDA